MNYEKYLKMINRLKFLYNIDEIYYLDKYFYEFEEMLNDIIEMNNKKNEDQNNLIIHYERE